jgi:yeast amino acid transporter
LEIVAASITLQYWWDKDVTRAPFVTLFLAFIIFINMLGVRGYGEAEFTFSILKIVAVIGFMYVPLVGNKTVDYW